MSETVVGGAAVVGLGYAFWLGKAFNLTINADVSAGLYPTEPDRPSSSGFFDAYVGLSWY